MTLKVAFPGQSGASGTICDQDITCTTSESSVAVSIFSYTTCLLTVAAAMHQVCSVVSRRVVVCWNQQSLDNEGVTQLNVPGGQCSLADRPYLKDPSLQTTTLPQVLYEHYDYT